MSSTAICSKMLAERAEIATPHGRDIMALLRTVPAQGRTLFVSIHQLVDAARMCDRLVLLSRGRVAGVGTLDELRTQAGLSQGDGGLEEVFLALT